MREELKRKLESTQAEAKIEGLDVAEGDHNLQDKTLNHIKVRKHHHHHHLLLLLLLLPPPPPPPVVDKSTDSCPCPSVVQDKADAITISMDKLQLYEESFTKIQEATGIGEFMVSLSS
jgi:hypothetical protein